VIPYAPSERFTQPNRISDLILRAAESQADSQMRSGQIWGNAVRGVGNTVADAINQRGIQKQEQAEAEARAAAEAPMRTMQAEKAQLEIEGLRTKRPAEEMEVARGQKLIDLYSDPEKMPTRTQLIGLLGPERGMAIAKLQEANSPDAAAKYKDQSVLLRDVLYGVAAVPENARPAAYKISRDSLVSRGLIPEDFAPPEYSPETFQQLMNYGKAPEAPKAPETRVVGRSLVDQSGKVIYRDPAATRDDNEPLVPVMGDDGKPVLMRRSQAEGRKPASNREQGRPVTSGDAGRLAELDTSLDDLAALEGVLGQTGAGSKIGAMLPNVVTEFTGLGEDSKQRQAMIDRVKQVIGKALEGGVLRKEDEAKYEKILPRIGDDPQVAATKIANLKAAITQRREREIEAREDAGYDVTKFRERRGKAEGQVNAPSMVKYQGKMVPFSSLPPDLQAVVLANSGGKK